LTEIQPNPISSQYLKPNNINHLMTIKNHRYLGMTIAKKIIRNRRMVDRKILIGIDFFIPGKDKGIGSIKH